METYLVGGAVRDMLLGLQHSERDWVVVGSTADEMLERGFTQVGREFPVFLHPQTKEEYALARTEKKSGQGHTGFVVNADPGVTLEEDLRRRDLTINAIAQKTDGTLVDPYHGVQDITHKVLRHVSEAFAEDPLRVLRVARFKARLHHLGFTIAPETLQLMRDMSSGGELETLAPERIWQELVKALGERSPQQFVQVLYQCGAMASIMPELDAVFHRVDNLPGLVEKTGDRIFKALEYAAQQRHPAEIGFALIMHALDSAGPPKNLALKRTGQQAKTTGVIEQLCAKLRAPKKFTALAKMAGNYTQFALRANTAKPDGILDLFDNCDAWRRPERFEQFLLCCEALIATAPGQEKQHGAALAFLRSTFVACQAIEAREFVDAGITGESVGESVRNARKTIIASFRKQFAG